MPAEWTETRRDRGHPIFGAVLVFIGSMLVVALIFSVWTNQQALDTDTWVSTSDEVLQDPAVKTELSQYISDELFSSIDVAGDLRGDLPPALQDLEDTSAAGLQDQAPIEVRKALNAPRFERIWSASNRTAHRALLKALDDGGGNKIILDLNPIVTGISTELGFPDEVTAQIPPDVARLAVLESDQVSTARRVTGVVRASPFVLGLLALFFFGLAVLVAGSRRAFVVGLLGTGLVIAGLFVILLRELAGNPTVDWLSETSSVGPAAEAVWRIGTSGLVTYAVWSMVAGVLVIVGAVIAGMWPDRSAPDRFRHEYDYQY